jgi:hypothetical protein
MCLSYLNILYNESAYIDDKRERLKFSFVIDDWVYDEETEEWMNEQITTDPIGQHITQIEEQIETGESIEEQGYTWDARDKWTSLLQASKTLDAFITSKIEEYNSIIDEWNDALEDEKSSEEEKSVKEEIESRRVAKLEIIQTELTDFLHNQMTVCVNNFAGWMIIELLNPGDIFIIM